MSDLLGTRRHPSSPLPLAPALAALEQVQVQVLALALVLAVALVLVVALVTSRMLAGVHWITDIIASVLVSASLIYIYRGVLETTENKNTKDKTLD